MSNKFIRVTIMILLLSSLQWLGGESVAWANTDMVNDCFDEEDRENCSDETIPSMSEEGEAGGDPVTWVTYVKLVAALAFVLILLYGLLKFVNSKTRNFQQSKLIQNIGGTTLGGNRSVQIVKIAGSYYLLGVGEDVQLIKEVTDEEEIQKLESYYESKEEQLDQQSPVVQFARQWLNRKKNPYNEESQSFQSLLSKQLDRHKEDRKQLFNRTKGKERNKDG